MRYRVEIDRHDGNGWTWGGLGTVEACTFDTREEAEKAVEELLQLPEFEGADLRVSETD